MAHTYGAGLLLVPLGVFSGANSCGCWLPGTAMERLARVLGCHLAALWKPTACWLPFCSSYLSFLSKFQCTEFEMPSRLWCPKWAKTNARSWDCCWTQGYYVGSVVRPAWLWLAVTAMMGILIHYLSVFHTAPALCLNIAAYNLIESAPSGSVFPSILNLLSMVQACNDIISESTDSAPIALLFGMSQGCKHETSVSWALMLGTPRCPQLHHLSAQLRRFPPLRLTRTALTGNSGTYKSCTC